MPGGDPQKRELIFMLPTEGKTDEELAHEAWVAIQRWRAKREADIANALHRRALRSIDSDDLATARELLQEAASRAGEAKTLLRDANPDETRQLDGFIRRCMSAVEWVSVAL